MKHFVKCSLALLLALVLVFQVGELGIAYAIEEVNRAVNPADYIELTVPEQYQTGENLFFIDTADWAVGERSGETLYIPIQRVGDLEAEADVVLKVSDVTARHDVNYTVELYKDDTEPELVLDDQALVELIINADDQIEYEPIEDEEQFGELINAVGEAEILDSDGNVIGTVTATPLDENGNPIIEDEEPGGELPGASPRPTEEETPAEEETSAEEEPPAAPVTPGAVEESEWTEGAGQDLSPTELLRSARNAYTGTVSDRQELSGGDLSAFSAAELNPNAMSEDEYNAQMASLVADDYPGKEYTLHFAAGEEAKFLVITPMYSEAAEGDAQIMLLLKTPSEGWEIGEDVNPVSVTILDEDEPEPVTVSMAAETVWAADGVAKLTVTRSGRLNAIRGVQLASWDGSAKEGDEYSGVGAKLYFPIGITSRTVEIPVYHGTEAKDFYVSITALADETVETATTHVIIPAAEKTGGNGELMAYIGDGDTVNGHPLSADINIRGGSWDNCTITSDTTFILTTHSNVEESSHYWTQTSALGGCAYDGIYLDYTAWTSWCDIECRLVRWYSWGFDRVHTNSFKNDKEGGNHWLYSAWDGVYPGTFSIEGADVNKKGPAGTSSYMHMTVQGVHLIKRQFEVKVEPAEVKPLLGVSDADVLSKYEGVFLDKGVNNSRTLWTDESFAVNIANTASPLRLAGLEAAVVDSNGNRTGEWVRIVTLDGKSQQATVTLTPDKINELQNKALFAWSANGSCSHGGSFYKGTLTVRPVFEYQDVTVELKQDARGELYMTAPSGPSLLWDFDHAATFAQKMGKNWTNQVEYCGSGWSQEPNYFTFTARGSDPFISIDTPVADASAIQWVKARVYYSDARNTPNIKMELFASCGNAGKNIGSTNVQVPITGDEQWHEYVFQVNSNWTGNVNWLRLDPMAGCKDGDAICIDYIAFFPTEEMARAWTYGSSMSGKEVHTDGTYTYHLGDKITFRTVMDPTQGKGLKGDGVDMEIRKLRDTGDLVEWDSKHYLNGTKTIELSGKDSAGNVIDQPYYSFKPFFSEAGNKITVKVSKEAVNYLNTTKGIFTDYVSRAESGNYYIYTIKSDTQSNVNTTLSVAAKSGYRISAYWTRGGVRSCNTSYRFLTGETSASNAIELQIYVQSLGKLMEDDGDEADGVLLDEFDFIPAFASITGTVVSSTFNLSTERSAVDLLPAKSAYVSCDDVGCWTDENGNFELPPIFTMAGGRVTYSVTYNGVTSILAAQIPAAGAPTTEKTDIDGSTVEAVTAHAGLVKVENFDDDGVHFDSVYFTQEGILGGTINAMFMNGKELIVTLNVDHGQPYYDAYGEVQTEHVKDVTLYFMDQITGEVHAVFSSNTTPSNNSPARWSYDDETGAFTLRIPRFIPDNPTDWTYGDVLMAQLTTDKLTTISQWTAEQDQKWVWDDETQEWVVADVSEGDLVDMVYEPVSTGIAVAADPDYEPQVMEFQYDNIAEQLGVTPQTDDEGNLLDDDTRYSFGSFPYIGEITATIAVLSKVVNSASASKEMDSLMDDIDTMAADKSVNPDSYYEGDAVTSGDQAGSGGQETKSRGSLNILLAIDETQWGGVRFKFGVVYSYGGGKGYQHQRSPYTNVKNLVGAFANPMPYDQNPFSMAFGGKDSMSDYGGGYFKFSVFLGVYYDYGYVEISTNNGAEVSHEMVFMGGGGFIGFNGCVGYTWSFMAGPVPMYINVEAGLNVTFYIGSEGNPQKTLQGFKSDSELKGKDFQFNFEFKGRIYVSGTIGIGWYNVLGVRITVALGFEAGYGLNITKWYPNLFDSGWGYTADVTFTGSVDLIVTSIDLYSATWPLPLSDGFLEYFGAVRQANKCISYVEAGIQRGNGTETGREIAQIKADRLKSWVDANELAAGVTDGEVPEMHSLEEIKELTDELKNWAYDYGVISWTAKNAIEMVKQAGVIGAVINGTLQEEETGGLQYHTNDHVTPQWVASDGALMAAYGSVSSKALIEDAYNQPSSKLVDIGGGKFLMVFLDDTASRDKIMAATLKWTVYDTADDSWTEPQTVQCDATVDGKPNLTDAGGKVILSWASIADAKYAALKDEIAAELREASGAEPADAAIQAALEADPARVMAQMDVFTVEFDKASRSFGAITQLTDDSFYDDYPQAVYDAATGDYIVMYSKTAQDDGKYDNAGDKLQDLIAASPDPEKTYSVICYMLYNNQTDAADTRGETHEPGWAADYLFPLETSQDLEGQAEFLAAWGGQRFLPSTLRDLDGGQSDPPIIDLSVCAGYNGLAAYAFTVDQDFDLNTTEDRELYAQFYNFKTHGTYVPVRVAGSVTETKERYNAASDQFETVETVRQVDVGSPRLVRNGGSTYLFWREDGQSLKYLNISELLNAKVAAVSNPADDNESDWTWALRSDGTFATDAATGRTYEPRVQKVDVLSLLTNAELEITDYDVITVPNGDQDDLYVVWTDAVTSTGPDGDGMETLITAQEIFATAMIRQEPESKTVTDGESGETETVTTQTVRWSKPYRLTRENNFNDGLALAVDSEGNLLIVHNQYSKLMARSETEMLELIDEGKIGVTKGPDGQLYAASLAYNSPVNLMLTRFEKIGSLEATAFEFSDYMPVAGETITVTAAIENVGLTDARGCKAEFYASKDGVRAEKLFEFTSDETIQVNTARSASFLWTVPDDGPDGYRIEAVISEGNGSGYYDAVSSYSEPFTAEPFYRVEATEATQEGDQFRVKFTASNAGNRDAEEGATVSVRLTGLYGNLNSDRYGNLESNVLYSEDVTEKLTGKSLSGRMIAGAAIEGAPETPEELQETELYAVPKATVYEGDVLVDIPVSVFRYCGYDAVQIVMTDKAGNVLAESEQLLVTMDQPVNLKLNGGEALSLKAGDAQQAALTYDKTVFIQEGSVVYGVDDPSVAAVDANGKVTGVGNGTTTLTATLLPSGRSASVTVTVSGGTTPVEPTPTPTPVTPVTPVTPTPTEPPVEEEPCDGGEDCPLSAFSDVDSDAWYHDGVHWALENSVMQGVGEGRFAPGEATTRAMLVTMLYRMEGEPETDYEMTFTDVEDGKWYTEAVRWAAANGIVNGYDAETFGPMNALTREQLAAILYRYAKYKGVDVSVGEDTNILSYDDALDVSDWANAAMCWAVGAGVIQGTGASTLSPKASATRAQVATMLMRCETLP